MQSRHIHLLDATCNEIHYEPVFLQPKPDRRPIWVHGLVEAKKKQICQVYCNIWEYNYRRPIWIYDLVEAKNKRICEVYYSIFEYSYRMPIWIHGLVEAKTSEFVKYTIVFWCTVIGG